MSARKSVWSAIGEKRAHRHIRFPAPIIGKTAPEAIASGAVIIYKSRVELLFDAHEEALDGVSHHEDQQDGHTGGAVVVALQAV